MVLCRRNEHQQGIGRAVFLFGKDGGHRFGARCRVPDELEIPISRYRIFPETDLISAALILNGNDRVKRRLHLGKRKTRVEREREAQGVDRAVLG